jgi:hypothetical protein
MGPELTSVKGANAIRELFGLKKGIVHLGIMQSTPELPCPPSEAESRQAEQNQKNQNPPNMTAFRGADALFFNPPKNPPRRTPRRRSVALCRARSTARCRRRAATFAVWRARPRGRRCRRGGDRRQDQAERARRALRVINPAASAATRNNGPEGDSAAGASTLTILDRTFDNSTTDAEFRSTDPR